MCLRKTLCFIQTKLHLGIWQSYFLRFLMMIAAVMAATTTTAATIQIMTVVFIPASPFKVFYVSQ